MPEKFKMSIGEVRFGSERVIERPVGRLSFPTISKPDYVGVTIVETALAVKREEDWSRCRSPGRARRRLKQGHRQHMVVREVPGAYELQGKLYIHPEIYSKMSERLLEHSDKQALNALYGKL